jgi:hypothetical protein
LGIIVGIQVTATAVTGRLELKKLKITVRGTVIIDIFSGNNTGVIGKKTSIGRDWVPLLIKSSIYSRCV